MRDMLKDYPELIQLAQQRLNEVVRNPFPVTPLFEQAVWALESVLSGGLDKARDEVEAAQASGDQEAVQRAKEKKLFFFRILEDRPWNEVDEERAFWRYFQTHGKAFE